MSYTLWARCDFPPLHNTFKISPNAKLADLKKEAISALSGLSGFDTARFSFYAVNYMSDVVALDKKPDDTVVSESGVKDRGYIFLRAPADLKPAVKGTKKKKDKSGKDDEKDRYADFTPSNAFAKLKVAKGAKKNIALEYIDIYFAKILLHAKLTKLPEPVLVNIIKRDTLNVKEIDLFTGVLAWGKEEIKRKDLEDNAENLRTVLANVLPHIRFPVLTTEEVAISVSPSGVLTSEQTLALFTYLGQKAEGGDPKLPSNIKFPSQKRKGRLPPAWFKFEDTMKHTQLVLAMDGTLLTSTTTSYYQPAFGNVELKEGIHEWEFVLQQLYSNTYSCCIGVTPTTFTEYTKAQMIGYPSHIPGWAFACGHGQKYHGSQETYGRVCAEGDVVKVRLDMEKKTIEFFINGTSLGVAYSGITGPVRPSISLYGPTTVLLRFPKS